MLQNALEQFAIHVPVMLALSTYLAADEMKYIALQSAFFVLGRLCFALGYPKIRRVYGFALNMFSNVYGLGFCLYLGLKAALNWASTQ